VEDPGLPHGSLRPIGEAVDGVMVAVDPDDRSGAGVDPVPMVVSGVGPVEMRDGRCRPDRPGTSRRGRC
jgi:hypothetical protein